MNASKDFDYIISLGEACFVATMLTNADKRKFSSPFDWIFGGNLQTRLDLILSDFKGFIEKDKMILAPELSPSEAHHMYVNDVNGLIFNHDFLKSLPFEDSYKEVEEKYNRRIERFLDILANSESILLLYFDMLDTKARKLSQDKLIEYMVRINAKFPKCHIQLLYYQVKDDAIEDNYQRINKYLTMGEYSGVITGPLLDSIKQK